MYGVIVKPPLGDEVDYNDDTFYFNVFLPKQKQYPWNYIYGTFKCDNVHHPDFMYPSVTGYKLPTNNDCNEAEKSGDWVVKRDYFRKKIFHGCLSELNLNYNSALNTVQSRKQAVAELRRVDPVKYEDLIKRFGKKFQSDWVAGDVLVKATILGSKRWMNALKPYSTSQSPWLNGDETRNAFENCLVKLGYKTVYDMCKDIIRACIHLKLLKSSARGHASMASNLKSHCLCVMQWRFDSVSSVNLTIIKHVVTAVSKLKDFDPDDWDGRVWDHDIGVGKRKRNKLSPRMSSSSSSSSSSSLSTSSSKLATKRPASSERLVASEPAAKRSRHLLPNHLLSNPAPAAKKKTRKMYLRSKTVPSSTVPSLTTTLTTREKPNRAVSIQSVEKGIHMIDSIDDYTEICGQMDVLIEQTHPSGKLRMRDQCSRLRIEAINYLDSVVHGKIPYVDEVIDDKVIKKVKAMKPFAMFERAEVLVALGQNERAKFMFKSCESLSRKLHSAGVYAKMVSRINCRLDLLGFELVGLDADAVSSTELPPEYAVLPHKCEEFFDAIDYAASQFSEGEMSAFNRVVDIEQKKIIWMTIRGLKMNIIGFVHAHTFIKYQTFHYTESYVNLLEKVTSIKETLVKDIAALMKEKVFARHSMAKCGELCAMYNDGTSKDSFVKSFYSSQRKHMVHISEHYQKIRFIYRLYTLMYDMLCKKFVTLMDHLIAYMIGRRLMGDPVSETSELGRFLAWIETQREHVKRTAGTYYTVDGSNVNDSVNVMENCLRRWDDNWAKVNSSNKAVIDNPSLNSLTRDEV